MSETNFPTGKHRLDEVLAEYLRAVEERNAPSEQQLIDKYPELADELRAFFDDKQQIDALAVGDANKTG